MSTSQEMLRAALLNQQLEAYIHKMQESIQDKLPDHIELDGCTIYCDHRNDTYMAVTMYENKKIIAIAQGGKSNTAPLMTDIQLTSKSSFALSFLQDKLSKQSEVNYEVILTGYKNGAAFAEILACQFQHKCFSFYSPGIKHLLKALPHISKIGNKIIGIEGAPDDYNVRYGSISRRVRLPIEFYSEDDAKEARIIIKDLFASTTLISSVMCFLPGMIAAPLGAVLPTVMAQFSGMSFAVGESLAGLTNLNIYLRKMQGIVERMDAKQSSLKYMIDILKYDVSRAGGFKYQIFEPKEWPKCKNFIRHGAEYLSSLRCFEELLLLAMEELKYMTNYHDGCLSKDYLNESKNQQLTQLTKRTVSSLDQFLAMFYTYEEEKNEDEDYVMVTKVRVMESDTPVPVLPITTSVTPSWQNTVMQKSSGLFNYFYPSTYKPR
jgi:hypothetical protein